MSIAVSRRGIALCMLLVIAAGVSFAALAEWRRGPFYCRDCRLGNPMADPGTRKAIEESRAPIDWVLGPLLGPSVVYVVCNSRACVDYRQNVSGRYEGSNPRPQQDGAGESDGGGGGGGDGSGGWNDGGRGGGTIVGGSDSESKGTGTVKVGKPSKKES